MRLLEERIKKDGIIGEGNVLKVDSFLNHQMDIDLICKLADEFYRLYENNGVNKILTIEASGIGIAAIVAQRFGVPMVFAKKFKTKNLTGDIFTAKVESFTHGTVYDIMVSKKFLSEKDNVLIIDDFLAKGQALLGLTKIVKDSGAKIVGCGIVIEKAFQDGGKKIRDLGIRVESLARIKEMSAETGVVFFD